MSLLLKPIAIPIWQVKSSIFHGKTPTFLIGILIIFWAVRSGSLSRVCGTWAGRHQGCQGHWAIWVGGLFGETWGISLQQKSVSFLGSFGFKTMRILVSRKFKFGIFEPPKSNKHHASQDCHGACIGIPTSCEPSKRVWAKVGKLAFNIVGDSTKYMHMLFFSPCVLLH